MPATATVDPAPHAEPLFACVRVIAALGLNGASLADHDRGGHLGPAAAQRPEERLSCGSLPARRTVLPLGGIAEQLIKNRGHTVRVAAATDNHGPREPSAGAGTLLA